MKKLGYILLLIAVFAACKDKTKFTLKGKVTNFGEEKKVFLYAMSPDNGMEVIDSTVISEKGEFKFSHSSPMADFYRVNIGANEFITVAENGDELELDANLTDPKHSYQLTGSDEAAKLIEFNTLKAGYMKKAEVIRKDFEEKVAANPDDREKLIAQLSPVYMKSISEMNKAIIKYALDHSNSLVSFYAMSLVNPTGNEESLVAYAEKVGDELKKNTAVKKFVEKISKMKAVQVGQQAPEFRMPTNDGKVIHLSDFKGKYTLIDFWASWCGPCRSENPNVVKAYNTYKNRNFTILGISLDKDKNAWAQAIKQDGLTWTHASELADFQGDVVKLYQVEAIPASFLLDPNGKIIARNLRGEELETFLNKTLP